MEFRARLGDAIQTGIHSLVSHQQQDGSWRGRYGGPMFLLPMYVCARYARATLDQLPESLRRGMVKYIEHAQKDDGSVGLHEEGPGCMFTSVLCYVAWRFLGVGPEVKSAKALRGWILANGTALGTASWGRFMLAVLNLYPYEGLSPILPELWLLPDAAPFHPGRLWCHARQVYLPMAYLYGEKAQIPADALILQLRKEIYDKPYQDIPFSQHKETVSPADALMPGTRALRLANRAMGLFEELHPDGLRRRALARVLKHIDYEDQVTGHIDIGPVNSILNAIVHHVIEPDGPRAGESYARLDDYLCETDEGVLFNGYNSTALWDTAFAVQSMTAARFGSDHLPALEAACSYIRDNQVIEDVPEPARHYRHPPRGGWPFSDREHGWPISDCTAEGVKAALALEPLVTEPVPAGRLIDAVRFILSMQNRDGGWATYEKRRGGKWLEWLNPSQVFADIMVDYSYVECTSACIQALMKVRPRLPAGLRRRISRSVGRGAAFIRKAQRSDGSWEGSWGVCFTYGTWFGVWGLLAAGLPLHAKEIRVATDFLLQRQNRDGGWGESYRNCLERRWVEGERSRVVNSAWALMTLCRAGAAKTHASRRAARFLLDRQEGDGSWPRETMSGVFNRTVLIDYDNYRRYFPVWALALYEQGTRDRNGT